jgi:hypothetical protein
VQPCILEPDALFLVPEVCSHTTTGVHLALYMACAVSGHGKAVCSNTPHRFNFFRGHACSDRTCLVYWCERSVQELGAKEGLYPPPPPPPHSKLGKFLGICTRDYDVLPVIYVSTLLHGGIDALA